MLLTLILCEKYSRNKLSKCKIYCINLRFRALFHTLESVVSPEGTIVRSGQEGKIVIRCLIWTLFHILFQMVSVNTWAREFSLNKLAKQPWNILNCCLFRVPHISQEAALVHFPWIKFLLHRTTKSCGNLMFDCEKMTNNVVRSPSSMVHISLVYGQNNEYIWTSWHHSIDWCLFGDTQTSWSHDI